MGLLLSLYIPPPYTAELPEKVTLVSSGAAIVVPHPAAILHAELPEKVTLVSVGLLLVLYIPPP